MTRGRAYLKPKKGEWIESTQLLYDMGFEFPLEAGREQRLIAAEQTTG